MKKQKRHRPSKIDRVAEAVAQDHKDMSTDDITRRRMVIACQHGAALDEIIGLQARLAAARARRDDAEARLRGLAAVVAKR